MPGLLRGDDGKFTAFGIQVVIAIVSLMIYVYMLEKLYPVEEEQKLRTRQLLANSAGHVATTSAIKLGTKALLGV